MRLHNNNDTISFPPPTHLFLPMLPPTLSQWLENVPNQKFITAVWTFQIVRQIRFVHVTNAHLFVSTFPPSPQTIRLIIQ